MRSTYRLEFDYSDIYNDGMYYYVKTKMPMYTDKSYVTLTDLNGNGEISDSEWQFSTSTGQYMGRVADLTDSIILNASAVFGGGGNSLVVEYVEGFNPMMPFFYQARHDSHVVNDNKIYDTYDDDSLGHVNRTSIAMGGSQFEVIASDPHRTTNYYLPTRLRVALGTKFDNNTWRLELYRLGRMRRGSGSGATNGYGYRSGGPRSHGLRTVVPRYVVPANSDGSFHLSDMLDTTSENGIYIMRLRDTSTNTVTQFAIQKLRFRRININSKSGGSSLGTIAACYLTF